jgi:predicted transcriptional regulator
VLSKPSTRIRTTSSSVFSKVADMVRASSIMTPRHEFEFCRSNDSLDERLQRMRDRNIDVIPMLQGEDLETGDISEYVDQEIMQKRKEDGCTRCGDVAQRISEENRMNEDLHIKEIMSTYLSRANRPKMPFFLVDANDQITGLITLADFDKVAVKMYLFALISELEVSLLDIVSKRYSELKELCRCPYCLRERESRKNRSNSDSLDEYYYLNLRELLHIVIESDIIERLERRVDALNNKDYEDIALLRNAVDHCKPLVSGDFPIDRLVKIHERIRNLISAAKVQTNSCRPESCQSTDRLNTRQ